MAKMKMEQNGAKRSGFRIMTLSNPGITTTRLVERPQITGINYRTAIFDNSSTHRVPKMRETQSGVSGKHVST